MKEFIIKMLEYGAELGQATTPIQADMIIADAERLYKNHIKELEL